MTSSLHGKRLKNCQYIKSYMLINMCVLNFGLQILVCICILSPDFSNADVHIANWDHDHHHTHSELWEGTCKVGEHQSPIDIVSNETIKEKWGQPFVFHGYEKRVPMHAKNNSTHNATE